MSTTSLPFERQFTVIGERTLPPGAERTGIGLILLHRSGRPLRRESIDPYEHSGADEIVIVLGPTPRYDVESIVSVLDRVRVVIAGDEGTVGSQINLGAAELVSPYALVSWTDLQPPSITAALRAQLEASESFAHVPIIRNERNEIVPSIHSPAFFRNYFRTIPMPPSADGMRTLYPYNDLAIYDRSVFQAMGGYDPSIQNPYWQRLDLGMRAYLWGESIELLTSLRMSATRELPAEDAALDSSYARFFLKNLAVRYIRDRGRLRRSYAVGFMFRSGLGVAGSLAEFARVRKWVSANEYQFVQDARRVTELWEPAE